MKILLNQDELDQIKAHAPVPLECLQCHNTFYKPKNQVKAVLKHNGDGSRKYGGKYSYCFCSSKCSQQFHIDNFKSTHIKTNCFICQKDIERKPSQILEKNFCSRKCTAIHHANLYRKEKPSKKFRKVETVIDGKINIQTIERKPFVPAIKIIKQCSWCNKDISRSQSQINKSKSATFFCNKSCKTKYLHKFQIKHKSRSRAEKYLVGLIKKDFPTINLLENYRDLLSNNLEIDIYLPDYKLCIELNGPVHYFPIWGQEKLDYVHNKDIQKQIEITKLQLNLMVIDISKLNSNQKTIKFLDEYYTSHIKPILNSKIESSRSSI